MPHTRDTSPPKTIAVTGGAGFIGSAVVRHLMTATAHQVVNVDKLTYAGNLDSLAGVAGEPRYAFERVDICDEAAVASVLNTYKPDAILHLAAESHVDRSIDGPDEFVQTNVVGTSVLLKAATRYWSSTLQRSSSFRFHHVSTDEVFGSLGATGLFTEDSPYQPNSPYSATKAASDHLVRAWHHTYGLPFVLTNCSNNYGPYQFPEKLIPLIILNARDGKPLPVYGRGDNVRDWLFVDDHARALITVLEQGATGESYNIGGNAERTNLAVVEAVCSLLDELLPESPFRPHWSLVTFVTDRPGHDHRYAIDASKIRRELGWVPEESFESGLRATVKWYLDNRSWCEAALGRKYNRERLGLEAAP